MTLTQEKYAYAVATVRIKEKTLLSTDFLEQLLSTRTYKDVRRQLVEHGWLSVDSGDDDDRLQKRLIDSWSPAGMLSMNLTDSVTIRDNLWTDWHIAPQKPH